MPIQMRYGDLPFLKEEPTVNGLLSRTLGVYMPQEGPDGSQLPPVIVGKFKIPVGEDVFAIKETRKLLGEWGEPPREVEFTVYVGANGRTTRTRRIDVTEDGVQIWGGAPTAP